MIFETLTAKAHLTVRQDRPVYDPQTGLWSSQQVGDVEVVPNILTNAGRIALHTFIYGTAAQRTSAGLGVGMYYIGLSDNATAPAAGDTALPAELSGNGLTRAAGSVTLPTGIGTVTSVQKMFTYTGGGTQTVQKTALFDAASGGNMVHEILFTQRLLATNDTITLIFAITLS